MQEQEAKIQLMREHVKQKYDLPNTKVEPSVEKCTADVVPEHVNFFKDLEEGATGTNAKNKDHEQELKEEKEKYEKQIGYLTYLGQDTNEATGNVSWYNKPRSQLREDKDDESDIKGKSKLDPICTYKHLFQRQQFPSKPKSTSVKIPLPTKDKHKRKSKHKKRRRHSTDGSSSSSSEDEVSRFAKIQQLRLLREQRLKREREEKLRADKLLAKLRGEVVEPVKEPSTPPYVQKYNSQFNPQLARQNAAK